MSSAQAQTILGHKNIDIQKWDNPEKLIVAVTQGHGLSYFQNQDIFSNIDVQIKPLFQGSQRIAFGLSHLQHRSTTLRNSKWHT